MFNRPSDGKLARSCTLPGATVEDNQIPQRASVARVVSVYQETLRLALAFLRDFALSQAVYGAIGLGVFYDEALFGESLMHPLRITTVYAPEKLD